MRRRETVARGRTLVTRHVCFRATVLHRRDAGRHERVRTRLEDAGAARCRTLVQRLLEQLPPSALTDVTRSVPPDIAVLEPDPPLPDPLVPEPVLPDPVVPAVLLPEPLVPEPLPDPFSIRPRTSTRWPTCCCRLLPVSITVPDIPALAPLDDPVPDAELDPDPLDPEPEPEPVEPEPDPLAPEPDPLAAELPEPELRDTSVRM